MYVAKVEWGPAIENVGEIEAKTGELSHDFKHPLLQARRV